MEWEQRAIKIWKRAEDREDIVMMVAEWLD